MIQGYILLYLSIIVTLGGGLVNTQEVHTGALCLSEQISYSTQLKCAEPDTQIQVLTVGYGANTDECAEACCIDDFISCQSNETAPQPVTEKCDQQQECFLNSVDDIPVLEISCNNLPYVTKFAVVLYQCVTVVEETTLKPHDPTTSPSLSPPSISSRQSTLSVTSPSIRDQQNPQTNDKTPDDDAAPGLIIGLSVAAGVILIVVIVILVVLFTVKRKRSSNQSQNSTKTLATSDVESAGSLEDQYGFGTSATQDRQHRINERNANIKRNLSIKSEEKKNKRPAKVPKSKSKSKTSGTGSADKQNKNNSNNSKKKEKSTSAAAEGDASTSKSLTTKDF